MQGEVDIAIGLGNLRAHGLGPPAPHRDGVGVRWGPHGRGTDRGPALDGIEPLNSPTSPLVRENTKVATAAYRQIGDLGGNSLEEQVQSPAMQYVLDLRAQVGAIASPTPPVEKYVNPAWYALALRDL